MNSSRIEEFSQFKDRNKSGGRLDDYRNSIDEDYQFETQSEVQNLKSKRKPSTPDCKNRSRKKEINLFEKNNVDYLVDKNAIQIEN